jgi:hypothetical protein
MSEIHLPKDYLSYSAMELWLRDKQAYRLRYYLKEPYFSTPYTEFGNEVGGALEDRNWDHPVLAPVKGKVPQQTHPEHKLLVEIEGVPVLGFLDDFNLETKAIEEYKTGIRNNGKAPWDRVKVRKHKQLPLYSLLVREEYGTYNPDIQLTWMETEWADIDKEVEFGGQIIKESHKGLRLTGHVEVFPRHIKEWELDRMAKIIRDTAEEISEDYLLWQKKSKSLS